MNVHLTNFSRRSNTDLKVKNSIKPKSYRFKLVKHFQNVTRIIKPLIAFSSPIDFPEK
jgi:hypothetical protein